MVNKLFESWINDESSATSASRYRHLQQQQYSTLHVIHETLDVKHILDSCNAFKLGNAELKLHPTYNIMTDRQKDTCEKTDIAIIW